jgi:hypothetical protein
MMYLVEMLASCKQGLQEIPRVVRDSNSIFRLGEDIQGVDDSRNVTEDCEEDVNQQIAAASALEEHTQRWEDDGKDDFADVTVEKLARRL